MSYEVGDAVPIPVVVKNAAGQLVDATVTVTVTKPDGTVITPAVIHESVGTYLATPVADAVGTWPYKVAITGTVTDVVEDQFSVDAQTILGASLAELKAELNMTAAKDSPERDRELRQKLASATRMVEKRCGPVSVKDFTQSFRACSVVLDYRPVVSITSVTPLGGVALSSADAVRRLDAEAGIVELTAAATRAGGGTIVYRAGRTAIPANLKDATLVIAKHLWETQRGVSARPGMGGDEMADAVVGVGWALPNRARELMDPDSDGPAVA